MRLLLDTCVVLWWLDDDKRIGTKARSLIADPGNDILISVASLWEIVVKLRIGKLEADIEAIETALLRDGFERLNITQIHLAALAHLPQHHRDPFDHLLIAQTLAEDAIMVSQDQRMRLYPVRLQHCSEAAE